MLMEEFEELLPKYEEYCEKNNLLRSTIDTNILFTRNFIQYLDNKYENAPIKIELINEQNINGFIKWKEENGVSPITLGNYKQYIKHFFDFMYEENYMRVLIFHSIPMERKNRLYNRKYTYFNRDEIGEIVNTAKKQKEFNKDYLSYRNYVMVILLCYTGITLKELQNIRDEDIDYNNKKLNINSKRKRSIYLTTKIIDILKEYQIEKNKRYNSEFFFVSLKNKQISDKTIQSIVKQIIIDSDIKPNHNNFSTKVIRHSVLKMMIEEGWEYSVIANISGLDLDSLTKYIELYSPNSDLKEIIYLDNHPFLKDIL